MFLLFLQFRKTFLFLNYAKTILFQSISHPGFFCQGSQFTENSFKDNLIKASIRCALHHPNASPPQNHPLWIDITVWVTRLLMFLGKLSLKIFMLLVYLLWIVIPIVLIKVISFLFKPLLFHLVLPYNTYTRTYGHFPSAP